MSVRPRIARLAALAALVLLAGCEDLTGVLPQDRLQGMAVLDASGARVATYVAGEGTTGRIRVPAGSTRTFRVVLVDSHDQVIPIVGNYVLRDPVVVTTVTATAAKVGTDNISVTGIVAGRSTDLILDVRSGLGVDTNTISATFTVDVTSS